MKAEIFLTFFQRLDGMRFCVEKTCKSSQSSVSFLISMLAGLVLFLNGLVVQ